MFFRSCNKIKPILLFSILFISICSFVFANPPVHRENSLTVTNNPGTDGCAKIGSQILATIIYTSDEQANAGAFHFNGIINPGETQLQVNQINGSELFFGTTANTVLTVVPGNTDGNVKGKFVITNASGTIVIDSVELKVDNDPPLRDNVLTCTVDGNVYTSGVALRSGQVATLTQKVTSNDIALVQVDLSDLGLGTYTMDLQGGASSKTYVTQFTVPDNYNTVCTCNVTLVDDAGNSTTYTGLDTLRITIDSRAPNFINPTQITTSNPNGAFARPGDTLTFTATIENYDNDSVVVTSNTLTNDHSATPVGSLLPLELVVTQTPNPGAQATFNGSIVLPVDSSCYYNNTLTFQFTATDNAGNKTTREFTFAGIIDLGEFNHNSVNVKIYSENNVESPVATLTSKLFFYSNVSSSATESTSVAVGLTPIGINTPLNLLYDETSKLFIATYTGPMNSILLDGQYVSFVATATDQYGLTIARTTQPILIDSQPPNIILPTTIVSSNLVPNLARPEDTLTFTTTLDRYDYDTITVTSSELLTNHGETFNTLFPINLTVEGNPTAGTNATMKGSLILPTAPTTCYYNGNLTFQFTATDDSGNSITREFTYTGLLDLSEFDHRKAEVTIYSDTDVITDVATATSKLYFTAEVSSTATSSTKVEVDLSPIGVATMTMMYDEILNLYVATYSEGITAVNIDGQYISFVVTATDLHDNTKTRTTLPPIIIDNVPPRVDAFTITGATGLDGSIINKDELTMLATVSGANKLPDPVSINLTTLDNTGVHLFTNTSGDQWKYVHTVATGTVDDDYSFVLEAQDNHGNNTKVTLILKVDNVPPVWISQQSSEATKGLLNNDTSDPFIIIGDEVTTEVTLENSDDGISIVIDLSELGNYGQETMIPSGGVFSYTFTIATGSINHGVVFPMTILDNAGNTVIDQATGEPFVASFSFPTLDQNPPDPQAVTITLTNHTNTLDKFPNSINIKKTINFNFPFIKETSYDDSATATVDVTYLCKLTDGTMEYIDENLEKVGPPTTTNFVSMEKNASYYTLNIVATAAVGLEEQTDYQFHLMMYDLSGNRVAVDSDLFQRIDLNPPVINSITVGTPGGGSVLKVGDTFTIKVEVSGNDGMPPMIDLTSLDPNIGEVAMNYESMGKYSYDATVGPGDLDNLVASWAITVSDGCDNSVTSYTSELTIDNKAPEIVYFLVTSDKITSHQWINYTDNSTEEVTFEIASTEQLTDVTFDLSAIGRSSSAPAIENLGLYYYYRIATTTLRTHEEFENYKFPATISDNHGNTTTVYSSAINKVDCEIPIINSSLCGAEISARSTSLSAPQNANIARIGDTVTIYASMTSGLDATASVTFSIDPGVASISKVMAYNEEKNRLEASFVIAAPGVSDSGGIWGSWNLEAFSYIITAADDVENIADPVSATTSFVAKNVIPTIASYSLTLNPDYEKTGVLNIASGTNRLTRDLLIASATLDNNAIIGSASLNLSSIGGSANYNLASITNSIVNNSGNGLDVASYIQSEYTTVQIPITITDEAGYTCEATHDLQLDTKAPEITSVTFDGENLAIKFSEDTFSITRSQWKLVGSATIPIGTTVKLDLSDESLASWTELVDNVDIKLGILGKKEVTNWASQPLYLEVSRVADTAAATDQYGNWIASYAAFPITITNYDWRKEPYIVNLSMTHNWPTGISFNVEFSQEMDQSSFVASEGVFFVNEPTGGITEFSDVAYDSWYVIQKNDTCTWTDNKNLKITLCELGRDWIANKLTSNTDITLKFAQISAGRKMVSSILEKDLKLYTIAEPYIVIDNRSSTPIPALTVLSDPIPTINLGKGNLKLSFNDKVWLFSDNYRTLNETDPLMGAPILTNKNGSNSHIKKITLFNLDNDETILLECATITLTLNDYASTTVNVNLSENDILNIMDYYSVSSPSNWGLQIEAGSFINMWGMGNTRYKPTSPGSVDVVESLPDAYPEILAVSVSDMPPTKDDVGNFTFDFELTKFKAGETPIPFAANSSPTAAIFEISTGDRIASATFEGWSFRTVRDEERAIATFKTSEEFTKEVNGVEAELRIFELKDVFGHEGPTLIASYVYDRTLQSDTTVTGFTTASESFIIDNVAPTVTDSGPILLGKMEAGRDDFYVDYSETMDTNINPSLTLATGATTISLTFNRWENADTRAIFTLDEAITPSTINGTWTYQISGGQDLAANPLVSTFSYTLIQSEVVKIVADSIKLNSIRNTMDINTVVVDKPLNFDVSPDYTEISFKYQSEDIKNLPHTMCFYNVADEQIGSATITQDGVNATASFNVGDFSSVPTTNTTINIKIIDIAENLTEVLGSFDYYAIAPDIATMSLSGAATLSQGIYYFRPGMDNMAFKARVNGNYNNPLNLLVASYSIPMSPVATWTVSTLNPGSSIYTDALGTGLEENLYIIMMADEAGNLNTNAAPLMLNVDSTPPSIESITPGPADYK